MATSRRRPSGANDWALLALLLLSSTSTAHAEQKPQAESAAVDEATASGEDIEEAGLPEPPALEAPAPAESPERQEVTAPPAEVRAVLRCRQVLCECSEPPRARAGETLLSPSAGCQQTQCRCLEPQSDAPVELSPPVQPPPTDEAALPAYTPAPLYGFTLGRRGIGLRLDVGFPFLEVAFSVGVHDRFELGLGYQGFYFSTNAPYGSLRLRLFQTPRRSGALAIVLSAGYTFIQDGEGHDQRTLLVGGDSVFGDLSLRLSAGRYRHSFVAALGLRLANVRSAPTYTDVNSQHRDPGYRRFVDDGEARLVPEPYFDVGYIGRVGRSASLFITSGLVAYTISDSFSAMGRVRAGVLFDFHPRGER
jgi:hypothetical protein